MLRIGTAVAAGVGVLLLVVGVGITVWRWTHPVSFGWFAYAPLSDTAFVPGGSVRLLVVGYLCSVVGAAVAGIAVGVLIGRHRGGSTAQR